jgi:hypothetical protein
MIADERWSCIDGSFEERLADLCEYDLSLRLPPALLATPKANAAKANMRLKRIIRMMIEAQLAETGAEAPTACLHTISSFVGLNAIGWRSNLDL